MLTNIFNYPKCREIVKVEYYESLQSYDNSLKLYLISLKILCKNIKTGKQKISITKKSINNLLDSPNCVIVAFELFKRQKDILKNNNCHSTRFFFIILLFKNFAPNAP